MRARALLIFVWSWFAAWDACAAPDQLSCAGADTMQALVRDWATGLRRAHAAVTVNVDAATRLSANGLVAMLSGKDNCVMLARELFPAEVAAYKARYGREPIPVPVATGSRATLHATHAIAIYVHASNPLTHLTLAQLANVFGAALPNGGAGKIATWGQLGLTGKWASRPVHVYGMVAYRSSGNPPGIVNYLQMAMLSGGPFRSDMHAVADAPGVPALQGIVNRVAADPDGIGYSGFGFARRGARPLSLAYDGGGPFVAGTRQNVAAQHYPLSRRIYLLFPPGPEGRIAPAARILIEFALGTAGQGAVARTREHFLPLTPAAAKRARALIDRRAKVVPDDAALPPYVPRVFRTPDNVGYRDRDGAIRIVGYNDMRGMLAALDILFVAAHPDVRFSLVLEGTRTAPPALAQGTSAFAPMGAPFEEVALAKYKKIAGGEPLQIEATHAAIDPRARSSPLAIYVNHANPLEALDMPSLARIFGVSGGIRRWGLLGLTGRWQNREIHVYGLAPSTALGTFFNRRVLSGAGYVASIKTYGESLDVVRQVARDPLGLGFADLNQQMPAVKSLALAACSSCRPSTGSREDIVSGRYPLDRHLYIYVRRPVDAFVREYLRLVLSRQGQAAISNAAPFYLPLNADDAKRMRRRLGAGDP